MEAIKFYKTIKEIVAPSILPLMFGKIISNIVVNFKYKEISIFENVVTGKQKVISLKS